MYMYHPYMRQQTTPQWMIVLTGTGSVSVAPDHVKIQLGIVNEDEELQSAQAENSLITKQVIQALLQLRVLDEYIQTSQYHVHPMYDFVDGQQILRGYQVNHVLTITLNDVDRAGLVIDTAVKSGANQVLSVQFFVQDESVYYRQALNLALKDAIEKAESIATTLNVRLNTTPIKIEERRQEGPIVYQTFAMEHGVTETPIQPGQIIIESEVKAYFHYSV